MNLLMIIPKLSGGGAEKTAVRLAERLSEKHRVILSCLERQRPLPGWEGRILFCSAPQEQQIRFFHELKKREKIQVSISFLEKSNYVNVRSRCRERVIVSVRNNYGEKLAGMPDFYRKWCEEACRGADLVVALSEGVKTGLCRMYRLKEEKVRVIYNACPVSELLRQAREPVPERILSFLSEGPCFLNVGRLVPQKGQLQLLNAFSLIRKELPEARLLILGTGPMEEELTKRAAALGLVDSVLFAGFVRNPYPILQRADVLLQTSLYEGLGNVILEAMALRTPVISTDCRYGPRELLGGGSSYEDADTPDAAELLPWGILCPVMKQGASPEDPSVRGFAEAAARLIRDRDLRERLQTAAASRAAEFSEERNLREWEELFFRKERRFHVLKAAIFSGQQQFPRPVPGRNERKD